MTNEDSRVMGSNSQKTVISGYGSAFYQRNFDLQQSTITLERAVLFVGHQFSQKQAFLKFNLNALQYIIAGLFLPRIGILNENHLPVNFNGVERPMVENLIIPATWRELGAGFYGNSEKMTNGPVRLKKPFSGTMEKLPDPDNRSRLCLLRKEIN